MRNSLTSSFIWFCSAITACVIFILLLRLSIDFYYYIENGSSITFTLDDLLYALKRGGIYGTILGLGTVVLNIFNTR
jgi:hypothetical protein